jgi:hypothetical protein
MGCALSIKAHLPDVLFIARSMRHQFPVFLRQQVLPRFQVAKVAHLLFEQSVMLGSALLKNLNSGAKLRNLAGSLVLVPGRAPCESRLPG